MPEHEEETGTTGPRVITGRSSSGCGDVDGNTLFLKSCCVLHVQS